MTLRRITLHLCFSIPVFAAATSLTILSPSALAQNATTSLRGTVKDPAGAVVPGAEVDLNDKASGQTHTTKANGNGEYTFTQIPPSTYTITVSASGFGNQSKVAQLLVNQPSTVDFALTVQSTAVEVDVSVEAATINTTDASLGDAKNNELVQALPSETRNPADLLSLEPGVFALPTTIPNAPTQDSRSGAVNGERSDQGNITLDGVDDNDQLRGLAFFPILRETQDSLDEFRTVTGNGGADAGRSSGAQVSLVTKGGSNKYHGAAYSYFRASDTVANDWFNKQAQILSGEDNRPPKLIRNIFGGDFGGRIIRDKLFFFGNFEGQRQAESSVVTQTSPLAAYQKGYLTYANASGGTTVLTPAQVTTLDAACAVCNTTAYPPGPGPNPNALNYFNAIPTANTTNPGASGDGLNEANYVFSSPNPVRLNTSIVRLDYVPTSKHRIFGRGNLQKDFIGGTEQFPGQPPSSAIIDNSKGMAFGDTWTISSSLVNDLRYGYIRQGYGNVGQGVGDYVDFRFLSSPTAETRSTIISVPVNNIVDNLSFVKGKHDVEVGANWRLVHINNSSNSDSFNSASTNPYWLDDAPPDPGTLPGTPTYSTGFANSYEIAYDNLVGTVPSVTNVYNYQISSLTSGTLLADGAPLVRHYKANEYETYVQDQWRILPNLTITYGLRWTILQTPWETKGQEVAPTIDTHAWFTERETAALQGVVYEPDLTFSPTGPYYGKPGYYPKQKNNIAPRFSIVYSPNAKTSIRAGAGIYYDHFGEGLVNTFDQNGSFGISSAITSQPDVLNSEDSPRYTARNVLPFSNGAAASTTAYPYTYPNDAFAITWGLDDHIKTPYTEAFDLSLQRDIPGGFSLEANYVGRLGRHLLQQLDLAQPVDYTDPAGGGDYYSAGTQLSKEVDAHAGAYTPCGKATGATVGAIPYFEHVFPFMQNLEFPGESATNAIYNCEWAPYRYQDGATTALADLDFYCQLFGSYPGCTTPSRFWQDQFSSLYALSSIGMSYYNALQVSLRHPSSHGFQADINYTFSKSIDMGSDAERTSEFSNGVAGAASEIINSWKPYLNRAVSDFDTKHIITVDSLYQLPFGKGKAFANTNNRVVNSLIGGWQLSDVFRATSGLPWDVREPGWTTDWQIEGYGVQTAPLHIKKHIDPASGDPAYFTGSTTATDINNTVKTGSPIRLPYPGETGQRNNFRGDGYLDLDTAVSKKWAFGDYGNLKFTWEVYNATNTVRFDPESIGEGLTSSGLGTASAELTQPRRMQFSLRYDF